MLNISYNRILARICLLEEKIASDKYVKDLIHFSKELAYERRTLMIQKRQLKRGIKCIRELIDDSSGVYDLQDKYTKSPWETLLKDGEYSYWLDDFEYAEGVD